jgi:para-nitrobenzyl esterase
MAAIAGRRCVGEIVIMFMKRITAKGNRRMRNTILFAPMLVILAAGLVVAQQPAPVKVESGLLQGTTEDGVTVYRGVPFAAPPVGDLRWRAPRPPTAWEGVRKADRFAPNPVQEMRDSFGPWTAEYQPQGGVSEDCLYLNIWTGVKSGNEKRPVMVYIPGGAFTGGSGNCPVYNGENLAKKGLVVVTVNYRVGVLGFLAHPELTKESEHHASGNYGLLDQLASLEWVKRNIAAFGGDPARVTIVGQSAGASSVHYLTASPLAKGLFIRAIAQSGSYAQIGPGESLASAEQIGIRFAKAKGATSLAALRAIPAVDLTAPSKEEFHFLPIIDGWFLPKSVDEIFAAGEQSDVATLTGWVADEGSFSDDYGKVPAEEFVKRVRQQVGTQADVMLKLYPTSTQAEAAESQKAFARDMAMVSMSEWAMNREKTGKTNVYTYLFTHPQPGATKERYQTFHSSELPYVFDNLQHAPRPWTAEDEKMAETMSTYWTNFIATGDPNGKGLPKWQTFREKSEETMELGDRMGPRPIISREKLEALKKLLNDSVH